jgi:dienelactone hydrolase
LPANQQVRAPAVLIPHGHWKQGRLEDQPSYSVPALGINLARQGYVAFAYDMTGYNDTRQTPHSFGSPAHALWSFHPMGLQLWNSIRALDYLQSLPVVDGDRIAVTGASGGGSQTIFLTAVDDRVKVAAPVNMVSAHMQGGDPCEEAPNLRLKTSNVEIAALAAPRPLLLVSSTHDWTRNTPKEEFPEIQSIYKLYGRIENVQGVQFDSEHNYNRQSRQAVYRFLDSHLRPPVRAAEFKERDYQLPSKEELLAYPGGDLPPENGSVEEVFQKWRVSAWLYAENRASQAELRDGLRDALQVDLDSPVESYVDGSRIVLSRAHKGDRVTGYWTPGRGRPVLLVDPEGAEAALRSDIGKEIMRAGRPILMIDVFTADSARATQASLDPYFLSYNRGDDAERVQDILTALGFLHTQTKAMPDLIGLGTAGIRSLFAAAVAPVETNLVVDLNGFSGTDSDFVTRFFVPGIQRAGGLQAALRLVGSARAAAPATARAHPPEEVSAQ